MTCGHLVPHLDQFREWEPREHAVTFVERMEDQFGSEDANRLWRRFVGLTHDGGQLMPQACSEGVYKFQAILDAKNNRSNPDPPNTPTKIRFEPDFKASDKPSRPHLFGWRRSE